MRIQRFTYLLLSSIAIVVILIYGKSILIPLVFALLLWFLVRKINAGLDKVKFMREKFPSWLKTLITSTLMFLLLAFVSNALSANIIHIANSYSKYQTNINTVTLELNRIFNIDAMDFIKNQSGTLDYGKILGSVFNTISDMLGNAFMILLYTVFIFLEESHFGNKLSAVFTDEKQYANVTDILSKIHKSIADYIGLKTLMSLITGTASYFVLLLIGIDSPLFWASLIFALNYIPTIGSLIATLFPAVFALLQFGEITPSLIILVGVGAIQVLVGNLLEPRLMGNSLNMSPLITIIALSFWGAIWGITGMILSIPITVIIVIICAQFEESKSVAILLSANGKV
jgi:AI-2 transport protein TqsA